MLFRSVVVTRRLRSAGVLAPVLAASIGAYMTLRQAIEHIPANAAWVAAWDRVHRPGLAVAVVLVVSTLSDRRAAPSAATLTPRTAQAPAAV